LQTLNDLTFLFCKEFEFCSLMSGRSKHSKDLGQVHTIDYALSFIYNT
jgi:uncharacterized cupin superfamily protein